MRRVVAILNPRADRGRAATLGEALQASLGSQFDLVTRTTEARGAAVEIASQAAREGCDAVVAIGGDGTVHEVANGLMAVAAEQRPRLGILPAGSGNDVAYALGITKDRDRLATLIQNNATQSVDVGAVRASNGRTCYCINNVGTLLEGQVNLASHQLSWPKGSGLYLRAFLQTILRRPPTAKLQITVDGQTLDREAVAFSVGNGPRSGGRFVLFPHARNGDGYFDFLLAPPMNRVRLLWELHRSSSGRETRQASIEYGRFTRLALHSSIALVAHVDGEPWLRPEERVDGLEVEVIPAAIRVLC